MLIKIFQKRFPTYILGALLGLVIVLFVYQMKKLTAPEFREVKLPERTFRLQKGGEVRLLMGKEPGHVMAWGFPTKLAVGKKQEYGKTQPVKYMEYKELVEPVVGLNVFSEPGDYEITGQFYCCSYPGDKYCVNVKIQYSVEVRETGDLSIDLPMPLHEQAQLASKEGWTEWEKQKKN